MTRFKHIQTIESRRGAQAHVAVYGEVGPDDAATAPYRSYRGRCTCGAAENFMDQNAAIKWAENHMDAHAVTPTE